MKALTGFLKQLLSNGQIDQGGVDILMSHPGGQVVKALLGIDALAIPPQHTMDHKGVAQVMDPGAGATQLRLETGSANHLG